jgi:predicted Zn-dependent protease
VLREGIAALPAERDLKTSLIDFLAARRGREVAERQLQGFIAKEPGDNQLRFSLAQFYEQGNEAPKAEAVYKDVIGRAGTDEPGLVARDRLAALRVKQNDVPGAEKLLGEVLAKAPRDDDALFLRGNLALQQRDPKTAIADLRSVLRDQPNAVGVMRVLARAHMANNEPALAEETMRQAVDANPNDPTVRLDLAKLLVELGKGEQAKPVVDELVRQRPKDVEARTAQFQIAAVAKDTASAKAAADAIVAINPKIGLGYYYQGSVAESEQHWNDAIRMYSSALDRQPNAAEPLQALTRLLIAQKRVPEALRRLDDTAAHFPDSSIALNIKGEMLASLKRTPESLDAFKAAIAREPRNWAGYRNLAAAQIDSHDTNDAIATLQAGVSSATSPEPLQTLLGLLYEREGKPDEALRVYNDALSRNPRSDAIANNLAMLLVDTHHDAASIERAKQLTEHFSMSRNAELLDTYGWVLYKHGDASAAVTALESASARAPNLPVLWYHLGMAQLQSGQTAAARDSLARSLKSGNDFSGKQQAQAELEKLMRS